MKSSTLTTVSALFAAAIVSACGGGTAEAATERRCRPARSCPPAPAPTPAPAPAPAPTCVAADWSSTIRYMPGDRVMRLGVMYVALPVSATVWNVNSPPEWTPNYWAVTTCSSPAPAPAPTPAPSPAPTPAPAPTITVGQWPNHFLQRGFDTAAFWFSDGVWGAGNLTRGTYTGLNGSQYEQAIGTSPTLGPNGEVSGRVTWKWPTGTTEVKSYPSWLVGNKPGFANSWTTPGGLEVILPNGTVSTTYPSGKTPGSFFPLQLPLASLWTSFGYKHNATPTGRGHLSYDIWLQRTPTQTHGFNSQGEITHEIMIPLDYWGGYGQHGIGRNPAWYDHDVVIDGRLFHVYAAKGADGQLRADFFGGWKFIVFEPAVPIPSGTTLDLAKFINYVATRKDSAGTPWAVGNEHAVSVELGVEPVDGTGDLTIYNYRVWK